MVVPPEIPVTVPEPEPMVATAVLLLYHVPPLVASLSVVVQLVQILESPPATGAGLEKTVKGVVVEQPAAE